MADPIWGTSTPGAFGDLPPGPDRTLAFLERLYGPMTARSREGLMPETASLTSLDEDPRITALREPGAAESAFGVMGDMAMQPVRAGESLGEALYDPTLANVTDAGVQTALTFGKPYAAAGAAGLGAIEALRRDLGASPVTTADAVELTRRQKREAEMRRQEEAAKAEADARRIEAKGAADAKLEADKARIAEETAAKASKREEYDRAVSKAEGVRDKELSRVRRFSDSEVGKVYDKLGGFGPVLAAASLGGLHRFATGGAGGALNKYVMPAIEGTGGAFLTMNAPLIYEGYGGIDSDNPEKAAFSAYARELPPGHPRKEEYKTLADELPAINPIKKNAQDEFVGGLPSRLVSSAVEGGLAGISGANAARVAGRMFGQKAPDLEIKAATKVPGRAAKWMDKVFGSTPPAAVAAPKAPAQIAAPTRNARGPVPPAQKPRPPRPHPDDNWDEALGIWRAPNGRFKAGEAPK